MTFKQSQGHQTYNDSVDSKQGYDQAKIERYCVNGVREKANVKVVFKQRNMSIISVEHTRAPKINGTFMIYFT